MFEELPLFFEELPLFLEGLEPSFEQRGLFFEE